MENYQFPSTYTAISGLLDDVDNSKQWNFELWHYCIKATICSSHEVVNYYFDVQLSDEYLRVNFRRGARHKCMIFGTQSCETEDFGYVVIN